MECSEINTVEGKKGNNWAEEKGRDRIPRRRQLPSREL